MKTKLHIHFKTGDSIAVDALIFKIEEYTYVPQESGKEVKEQALHITTDWNASDLRYNWALVSKMECYPGVR